MRNVNTKSRRNRTNRPPRIPNGTHVHVRSDHFAEECNGRVTKGHWDGGWLYRIEVTAGDRLDEHRNQPSPGGPASGGDGELWVCDFEVQLL